MVRCVCDGEGKVLRVYFRLHVQHPQPTHTARVSSSLHEPNTSCLCVQTADTQRDECDCSRLSSSREFNSDERKVRELLSPSKQGSRCAFIY